MGFLNGGADSLPIETKHGSPLYIGHRTMFILRETAYPPHLSASCFPKRSGRVPSNRVYTMGLPDVQRRSHNSLLILPFLLLHLHLPSPLPQRLHVPNTVPFSTATLLPLYRHRIPPLRLRWTTALARTPVRFRGGDGSIKRGRVSGGANRWQGGWVGIGRPSG